MNTPSLLLLIEIASSSFTTRKGVKDGKPWEIRSQEGYLHNGHAYPDRFTLSLGRDETGNDRPPYQPGMYTLAPGSVEVNREYGQLAISRSLVLVRLPDADQGKYKFKAAA